MRENECGYEPGQHTMSGQVYGVKTGLNPGCIIAKTNGGAMLAVNDNFTMNLVIVIEGAPSLPM